MMTKMSKRDYLLQLKKKYRKADRKIKTQLLNDFCDFTKYHRKYALNLINKPFKTKWKEHRIRKRKYDKNVIDKLLVLWRASNEICGERFHPFIPIILEKLKECETIKVKPEIEEKLLQISLSSVKRTIRRTRRRSKIKISTTRPGSILKKHITVRYGKWQEKDPGWCEMDTVSHCGIDPKGEFLSSVNLIDVATGWSEQAAIMGKSERFTLNEIKKIQKRLPFKLYGLDSDNGSEFINWHMYEYCKENRITFTRGRPYYKNDGAHVEQKNYTAIRQLIGYGRLDKPEQKEMLNDLYRSWRLYINFFQPSLKLKKVVKITATGKLKKKYFESKTPYQRLIEHEKISRAQKLRLICQYEKLNPIKLQEAIKLKLIEIKKTFR